MSHVHEVRLTDRLLNYWNLIRKDAPMADFAHFNPIALSDVWPQCTVLTVLPAPEGKPPGMVFLKIGDALAELYGRDMQGQPFNPGQRMFQAAAVLRRVGDLVKAPAPLADAGQFVSEKNKVVKYRAQLLPLGRDGKVTHILAGISWREF